MLKVPFCIFSFSLFLMLLSCGNDDENCGTDLYTLNLAEELSFPFDTVSAISSQNGVQYCEIKGEPLLVVSNFKNWRIDFYNLATKSLSKIVHLEREGPNGLGHSPSGFYFHNNDSIFLFFNKSQRLYMLDSSGHIKDKTSSLKDVKNEITPVIDIGFDTKAFFAREKLYFSTYGLGYSAKAGAILDLKERKVDYPFDLPGIYSEGWWAGVVHSKYLHDYNYEENLIVQSFGNDHSIYVIDSDKNKRSYCAKSKYLPDKITPFSKERQDYSKFAQQLYKNEAIQGSYSSILYDKWRNVYYRLVFRPVPKHLFHSPLQIWDDISIVIIDSKFNKVGETDLPKAYRPPFFVSERGLSFFNKEDYEETEDRISFGCFKLKASE